MNWPKQELGPLCLKIGSGVTPRGGESVYTDDGVALIRSQNIYNGQFDFDGLVHITDTQADAMLGVEVTPADILLNITGDSVARCCRVPKEVLPARVNQHVAIVRPDPNRLDPDFLCYFLVSPHMQAHMLSFAGSGGTRNALTKGMIERFTIPLPDMATQKAIVVKLRAYDDLITNNRRRIELLERSVRHLFKEWFVRLRYPGHEHDKVENDIPQGWQTASLGDLCVGENGIQTGPFGSQLHEADYTNEGVPVIMPRDLIDFRISSAKIAYISEAKAESLKRHRMRVGDVVYGRRGDIGRRAYISERETGWFCGTGCLRFRPNLERVEPRYLFAALGHPIVLGSIVGRAKGSTMANLNASILRDVQIQVPTRSLQREYAEFAGACSQLVDKLERSNERLKSAHDLLLPRLLDGRISV